jgi:hypothetical protein
MLNLLKRLGYDLKSKMLVSWSSAFIVVVDHSASSLLFTPHAVYRS